MRNFRFLRKSPLSRTIILSGLVIFAFYLLYLNYQINSRFDGSRWEVPSRVYARPMELYVGKEIGLDALKRELLLIRYQQASGRPQPGQYQQSDNVLWVHSRKFQFWDGSEPAHTLEIQFGDDTIQSVKDYASGEELELVRLEPMFIGAIYPQRHEDRVLLKREDIPQLLIDTLLLVEDRRFYEHSGISVVSILRALVTNIKAGERVQGGSTVTQQLVKNYFLSNDKSYWRKINEAIMSLMLEWHYSKDEILEAYFNEIYLGQEGNRAIHGFGLASWFYFSRPIDELNPAQVALLVAMVKGASYYDPRRHSQRAKERRDLVLKLMMENDLIPSYQYRSYIHSGLDVVAKKPRGNTPYPAFVDLVKRQLSSDYNESDLRTAGLRIFTTLDPLIQQHTEKATLAQLERLEKQFPAEQGKIESAVIVSLRHSAEIQALIGGRDFRFSGLNRAININRAIGSLVKPAIYLEALSRPEEYNLASLLNDDDVTVDLGGDKQWTPSNYDAKNHGEVPMYKALAQSYNLAAVRLGLSLGVEKINERINSLGVSKTLDDYPSNLLGAIELSPFEVTQMFQTLADGGFYTPLRAIRSVTTNTGEPLQRYAIETRKVVDEATSFLINIGLQNVVQTGTARGLSAQVDKDLYVAGKTGTTNDKRDSWFAGFSQQYVGVAWLGHDDFSPTVFSGASGAMKVWGNIMAGLENKPLVLQKPEDIMFVSVDRETGLHVASDCASGIDLPINIETFIGPEAPCSNKNILDRTQQWLKQLF